MGQFDPDVFTIITINVKVVSDLVMKMHLLSEISYTFSKSVNFDLMFAFLIFKFYSQDILQLYFAENVPFINF